ncbi:MAG: CPBP family intramembrane metalloprotease [Oscillatoriales cyanobacterium C42_A2020_001]|nr:CPBP family intramembrane metalloprotease [Leptolyngbyaceae cyanobacterium C42_A2020_001]
MRIHPFATTSRTFLNAALQGRNAGWRYLLGIGLAILLWLGGYFYVGIPIAQAIAPYLSFDRGVVYSDEIKVETESVAVNSSAFSYISSHIAFAFLCIGILSAVKLIHHRKMLTLISPDASFQAKRFWLGFGLWLALASLQTLIEFLLQPRAFVWNFQPLVWLKFLPLALLLTPIQTSGEELLFRGYLLQGLGLIVRQPIGLIMLISLPFAIVHFGNPEMERGAAWIALTYLVLAIFLTTITLQDNRLELALGVHAANNLFIVLLVNTRDSVLQTPAMILQSIPTDPKLTFVELLVSSVIFCILLFGKRAHQP